jgi:3D (Asp-Asp-Asp) domain-containing protein
MDDTSRYGKVRIARAGETPTHLALEGMSEGAGLIVRRAAGDTEVRHEFNGRIDIHMPRVIIERQGIAFFERPRRRASMLPVALALGLGVLIGMWACNRVYDAFIAPSVAHAATIEVAPAEESEPVATVAGEVSAYTSSVDETDDTPFLTAAGTKTRRGVVACPSKYALGTVVQINGKEYVCEDRMNPRYRNTSHFDIWVPTKAEAFKFGRQHLTVTIK